MFALLVNIALLKRAWDEFTMTLRLGCISEIRYLFKVDRSLYRTLSLFQRLFIYNKRILLFSNYSTWICPAS